MLRNLPHQHRNKNQKVMGQQPLTLRTKKQSRRIGELCYDINMTEAAYIPLDDLGQGIPLPSEFPYRGEWMAEGTMFLYRPLDSDRMLVAEMTATWQDEDGKWVLGFNAASLAFMLKISIAALFENNRAFTLHYLGVDENAVPYNGGIAAKDYYFECGGNRAVFHIELPQTGNA
jgi:hypothetical protein